MRTPKPEQLKSGNWRIQLQIKGHRYSITAPTKKEVREKAKQLYAGVEMEKRVPLTLGKAIDKYIEVKAATLSPSTIRGYKAVRRNYFPGIIDENISDLTQADIQLAMSSLAAKGLSPKTIKNAHGILNSTFEMFRPDFTLRTRLPESYKSEMRIFSEAEMKKVFEAPKGIILDYEPCDECKENRKLGVTLMEVSDKPFHEGFPEIQNGIYPSGRWCVIKREAAERMFSGFLNDKNALFVDSEIFDRIVRGNET